MSVKIPEDLIIKDIKRVIEEKKDTSLKAYKTYGKYSECAIRRVIGTSWADFLKSLGYETYVHRNVTKEDLVEDVLRVFNDTGITKQENYIKYGKYSRAIIKRIFGSWNKMLKALGYQLNMFKPGQYSREDILNEYKRLKEEFGRPLNAADFRKYSKFSQPIVDNVFGSFTNMKKELGEIIDARFLSNEDLEKDILRLHNQYGAITEQLVTEESIVSYPTILARYGTVENLCNKIGVSYNPLKGKSKLLIQCLTVIKKILGDDYRTEKTFPWLRNPKTNHLLFIDIFYPKLKLAIEVDGGQHFQLCRYTPTEEALAEQQARDQIKNQLLMEHGYKVVRLTKPTVSYIKEKLDNVI